MTLRSRLSALALATATLLAALPALAGWETHQKVQMKFNVPDKWETTSDGTVMLSHPPSTSKHPAMSVKFVATGPIAQASKGARDETDVADPRPLLDKAGEKLSNVKSSAKPQKVSQNGLSGVLFTGTAKSKDGKDVRWTVLSLGNNDKKSKALVVVAVGAPDDFQAHSVQLQTTLDSIQPS